ncbi:hypothetical protein [Salinirussus salinus]|uniref:hypothetical protein n=1 Tax=Salinirussus salinus TaxID=1198300 RepID=UPI00135996AF|nr:hypothetical protein [Salinirussus salinus]
MKLTRRNALIGLGSLVAGSGALVGTGAFSSVEADRTVSIGTTGDNSALLGFTTGPNSYNGVSIDGGGSTTPTISINTNSLNDEATTRFNGVLTVTNDGSDAVDFSIDGTPSGVTFYDENDDDLTGTSVTLDASGDPDQDLDLEINTRTATEGDTKVTFLAE